MTNARLIDISVPLTPSLPVWPGDPSVQVAALLSMEQGDSCRVSTVAMSCHSGTHLDAPFHYLRSGPSLEDMPLTALIGPCRVVDLPLPARLGAAELERIAPRPGERLLLKTRNSARRWDQEPFDEQYAHLSPEGASLLARRGVQTVGIDYLSVGAMGTEGEDTHRILLQAGIWIIEGLYLGGVAAGDYELLCLPLRGLGGDGAPARAVLRELCAPG